MRSFQRCLFCLCAFFGATSFVHGDLVAHWTADNVATDATPNGHDGTMVGAIFGAGIDGGQAFSFDGVNDYVSVAADSDLESSLFSVAAWVNGSALGRLQLLIDSSHGGAGQGWALQIGSGNDLRFAWGSSGGFPEVTTAFSELGDGDFHHVAATVDGSNMRLYVDGELKNTLAMTDALTPSGRDIRIGGHYTQPRYFLGSMDDIRIFNNALSASEIRSLAGIPEPTGGIACLALLTLTCLRRRK